MKNFKHHLIITILFYSVSIYSQSNYEASLKGKKIKYVYGGWEGDSPKQSVDVFVLFLSATKITFLIAAVLFKLFCSSLMEPIAGQYISFVP